MIEVLPILIILLAIVFWVWYDLTKKAERHLDQRGYYRNGYGRLVHRIVAYNFLYDYPLVHPLRFGEYDVHHIDRNKLNNHPGNLQILTREEHKREHGFF